MHQETPKAWLGGDDQYYAWPPPEGWYLASNGRWYPDDRQQAVQAGWGPAAFRWPDRDEALGRVLLGALVAASVLVLAVLAGVVAWSGSSPGDPDVAPDDSAIVAGQEPSDRSSGEARRNLLDAPTTASAGTSASADEVSTTTAASSAPTTSSTVSGTTVATLTTATTTTTTTLTTATTATPTTTASTTTPCNPDPNYEGGCVPNVWPSDVDCAGGGGDGPVYFSGTARVVGDDRYGLDRDGDGIACSSS